MLKNCERENHYENLCKCKLQIIMMYEKAKYCKGTGYSERAGKVVKNLCGKGTNELKSGLQSTCHLILMKIYVLSHNLANF